MKGQGTFRRVLASIATAVGLAHALPKLQADRITDPTARAAEEKRKGTKSRWRGRKHRHTQPRKGWPVLYWGNPKFDCPKPLSRKALKRIAPGHPLLAKAKV
jgi:hypothetical protein